MDAVYYHATEYYKKYVDNVENMFDDHDNNTLKPRQNKHHFLLEWRWINFDYDFTEFITKGPIYDIPALVQIVA